MDTKYDYVVIDTETGGLDPSKTSLLQVGVVFVKDGQVVNAKEWNIKSDIYNISAGAMKVNKIDIVEHDKNSVTLDVFYNELSTLSKEYYQGKPTVIGHNLAFDLSFIHHYVGKEKWEKLFSYRNIDTATIARFLIDSKKLELLKKVDLDSLSTYFNVIAPSGDRHTALYDAKVTWKVYCKMLALLKSI